MRFSLFKLFSAFKQRKELRKHRETTDVNRKLVFAQSPLRIPRFAQLKYLFVVFSPRERLSFFLAFFIFVAALLGIGTRYYLRNTFVVPIAGGEYSEALVGKPEYVNPILSQTSDVDADITRLVFSSLFTFDVNQNLIPDLVNTYALSEDQRTYTFYLRQDATWHDGVTLTADDVIFTILSIQDPEFQSPLLPSLRGVQVNKIDDFTFNMTLTEPFAPFLSGFTFGILPEHLWYDIPPANARLAQLNLKPIGSGLFRFDTLVKDKAGVITSYTLVRNDSYYGQKPYLERVHFALFPDIFSALEAIRKKEVDGLGFIPKSERNILVNKNKNLEFYSLHLPQYSAVFFNQKNSLLADKQIRKALVYGFDRERIIREALVGDGDVIYTPILPGYIGHNAEVEKYGYDPERAKKILDEAGWVFLDGDAVRHKNGKELAFAITTVDQPEYVATANILKESWEKLAIRVELNIISQAEMQSKIIKPRAYEALLFGEIVGIDPDPYPFWHSSQSKHPGLNLAVFFNKNVDKLLEEARKTSDAEQRRLKYLHFQNILADELPAIFLYNPFYTYAVSQDVRGVASRYITTPSDRFRDIVEWYRKTERQWKTSP
ncbi:MAG: hypothetical protein A3B74_01160 [Candidatus Kerfeldbacteria bacterium RIFCSPHIGHO2_02_FULL_42_14]|uniref:Solute-binding protein family 5 domain-containing protein n=1 Tax=Candidatus Kerfeldbacteria bacterium RIFCSPHIGHO2_02_FULL_42_14 TaxID=1798540 RepID=A0A1G2ATT3_9BACT|nr:MAG: hypothetical protein A3B74_01160 [Candidatus Kerfeldbacteria bacterium RIFCSPHIGHO2_02_FULL_42_14]OGY81959.1 MAG: hypothetical protein A3E60_01245 [Candidatus Kerfeldbacteria bacterium RIFCSPHIGHO2_12_FULL_42_13]OGY83407.1 MAG: hypothetical protein A3I91_02015 [Candidatus Kerfeldbacteria bacterium RIFCSPLOWO2_02_FULL_42_19]OGY85583.1 MAG: hypothetical protein A3G01_03810 [Candidatus Kerfeldbacteria bacterium RIFCSPLOWO2_12_FULL_43_9]